MNKKPLAMILVTALALLVGAKASAQEWNYIKYSGIMFRDATELPDGSFVVLRNVATSPTLVKLASDGTYVTEKSFQKPGYQCNYTGCPQFFANGQGLWMVAAYSPDHDSTSANYFKNFEPPTDHAILGLYLIDDTLGIAESHEMEIPVDTTEYWEDFRWAMDPNLWSGNVGLASAFGDGDAIVGAYCKRGEYTEVDPAQPWIYPISDSMYFFRMDFDGHLVGRVGYPFIDGNALSHSNGYLIKAEGQYRYYYFGEGLWFTPDKEPKAGFPRYACGVVLLGEYFQLLGFRGVPFTDYNEMPPDYLQRLSVCRSSRGTTYLGGYLRQNPMPMYLNRIYELDDDASDPSPAVGIIRYEQRDRKLYDICARHKCIDMAESGNVYFCYTVDPGPNIQYADPWIAIECMNPDLDTVSTIFFDNKFGQDIRIRTEAVSIHATSDNGLLLTTSTWDRDTEERWTSVTKFTDPLVGIEEAHDNGFKLAIAYPNPGNDVLNLCTGLQNARVEVYDMNGNLVHSQEVTEDVTAINAESWAKGVYVWKVISNGKEAETGKWVKE